MKARKERIAALTAYDYVFGTLLDEAGIEIILVGDSCAMVVSGHENTLSLTMDEAVYHCRAVRRAVSRALLVADMPFLSFQISVEEALRNAGRFFKEADVDAVKIEGGALMAETVRRCVEAGMPVMGHLGLRPQSVKQLGGFALQANSQEDAHHLLDDALELERAGAFSLVLEKIPAEVARQVTNKLAIPTIGIGAGPHCDGQILVTHDVLGMFEKFQPKFVRRYAEMAGDIKTACKKYIDDVKANAFPNKDESYL
ncbi:3-methyl-2-oxobutanoate hydroxymethyltransferase [candidate division KSB1 bacterium RBG_16_48_16]|nr:MAG: 3-methyl-2-oxobutanoate hydroxymethyltransferase [candidate division KSB1 bacterium RBG_16_48_16]